MSPTSTKSSGVRLAEVLASLSIAADLGTGTITFRLENSRMAEARLNLYVLGLLQQVGIIPAMA